MNITIIGTGYVGLVTGACLADLGNNVFCLDVKQPEVQQT
jgi:UDPglucose 6-dehydrogenase